MAWPGHMSEISRNQPSGAGMSAPELVGRGNNAYRAIPLMVGCVISDMLVEKGRRGTRRRWWGVADRLWQSRKRDGKVKVKSLEDRVG